MRMPEITANRTALAISIKDEDGILTVAYMAYLTEGEEAELEALTIPLHRMDGHDGHSLAAIFSFAYRLGLARRGFLDQEDAPLSRGMEVVRDVAAILSLHMSSVVEIRREKISGRLDMTIGPAIA